MRNFLSQGSTQETGVLTVFIGEPLPFVTQFVDKLDVSLRRIDAAVGMSRLQKSWLSFCSHRGHQLGVLETL